MRYFTAEMYEKMQIRGSLVFHETEDDLEMIKQWYVENDRDYQAETLMAFEMIKPFMMKYAPLPIREIVEAGELSGVRYPNPEAREMAEAWSASLEKEWTEACKLYWEGYATYENKLPEARESIHRLHDSKVVKVHIGEDRSIELLLDSSGSMLCTPRVRLLFQGVSDYELPEDIIGNWWLYEELYRIEEENSCSVNALLATPRGHLDMNVLKIVSEHVTLQWD